MLGFLIVGLFMLARVQNAMVEEADEAEQTAQDYSICVQDPDANATNPDEWQTFFSQFGHVTYVSVAIDNGELLRVLADRRLVARKIAFETATPEERASMFDPNENDSVFDELSSMKRKLIGLGLSSHVSVLRKKITALDEKITELCKKEYKAVKVYVVFETEAAQRACLREMTVGTIPALFDQAGNIPEHQKFRGDNVLLISEAPEPTDLIWENLETTITHQIIELGGTGFITCAIVAIAGLIIVALNQDYPAIAAIFISLCNGGLPTALKILTETEEHLTNTSKQSSLLLKLVLSRWMTTALIIWNVRSFEDTLKEEFLVKVATVLFADAFTTPIIRLLDPAGRLARNYTAKSAPTQAKMNSNFENTAWFLAERYTDMTKSLFVGLFFSVLYPGGLVFSLCSFVMCYWVDRYCLFRLWKQPPAIDASLTAASRLHIAVICVVHCLVSGLVYAGFPFDNLDITSTTTTMNLSVDGVSSTYTDALYTYESDLQKPSGLFQPGTKSFMTDDQKDVVGVYTIINITVMVLVCVGYFGKDAAFSVYKLTYGSYVPVGDPNPDEYSFVPGIETYVPTLKTDKLPLPLLCCDLSLIDLEHISFTADYTKQDVTKDTIIQKIKESGVDTSKCFSVCKQYKSPKLLASESAKGK